MAQQNTGVGVKQDLYEVIEAENARIVKLTARVGRLKSANPAMELARLAIKHRLDVWEGEIKARGETVKYLKSKIRELDELDEIISACDKDQAVPENGKVPESPRVSQPPVPFSSAVGVRA